MPKFVHTLLDHPAFWVLLAVLLFTFVSTVLVPWWKRRRLSSFTRRRTDDLSWWGLLPAEEQEAVDTASLDLAEQAEIDARWAAADAAAERAARINTLFRP